MDKICCLSYLLYQSDDEEIKNIAIGLLNGDVSLMDIRKIKEFKPYIKEMEAKINKVNTHEVTLFVEKFMSMA